MLFCYIYELHLSLSKESIHLTHFSPLLPLPLDYLNKIFSNSFIFTPFATIVRYGQLFLLREKKSTLLVQDSKYKNTYLYSYLLRFYTMRFSLLAIVLLCGHLPITFSTITIDEKQRVQRRWNAGSLDNDLETRETPGNCTPQSTRIREEW